MDEKKKKKNTAVFIIVATLLNIVCMMVLLAAGLAILSFISSRLENPDGFVTYGVIAVMFIAVAGSWFLYSFAVRKYLAKHKAEDNFAPVFGGRKKHE